MKTIKKSLCMLLSIIMILGTVVVGFNGFDSTNFAKKLSGLFANKAEAADSGTPKIKIVVPETIYLEPNATSATKFQYYVNNESDGLSADVTLDVESAQTQGLFRFYCSEVLTACTVHLDGVRSDCWYYGENNDVMPWKTGDNKGIRFGIAASDNMFLAEGLAPGKSKALKWTIKYTVGGKEYTAYAYSTVYAPLAGTSSVAAAMSATMMKSDWRSDPYLTGTYWITGGHSVTTEHYAASCERSITSKSYSFYTNPLIEGSIVLTGGTTENYGATDDKDDCDTELPPGLPAGHGLYGTYLRESGNSDNDKPAKLISTTGGTLQLYVDTTRYNDYSQIPNLTIGYDVNNESQINVTNSSSMEYKSDHTAQTGFSVLSPRGRKVNRHFEGALVEGDLKLKSSAEAQYNVSQYFHISIEDYVYLHTTYVDKTALRTKVQEIMNTYSADEQEKIAQAYEEACLVLGQPDATPADCTNALTGIDASIQALTNYHPEYAIEFVVPETIYLTPAATALTFQYYLNNIIGNDGNGTVKQPGYESTGDVSFKCDKATDVSITCSGATINGKTSGMAVFSSSNSGVINDTIGKVNTTNSLSNGITQGTSTTLTWTATYTVDDRTYTAKQYTVCYAPYIRAVAAIAQGSDSKNSGAKGATVSTAIYGVHEITASNFTSYTIGTTSGSCKDKTGSAIYYRDLTTYSSDPISNSNTFSRPAGLLNGSDGTAADLGCSYWFKDTSKAESANVGGGIGKVYFDSSRISKIGDIPNFHVYGYLHGLNSTNSTSSGSYTANYGLSGKSAVTYASGTHLSTDPLKLDPANATANKLYDQTVSNGTNLVAQVYHYWKRSDGKYSQAQVQVDFTGASKSAARSLYYEAINAGRQAEWYAESAWSTYQTKLKNLGEALGNVTQTDVSTEVAELRSAIANLPLKTCVINYRDVSDSGKVFDSGSRSYIYGNNETVSTNTDGYAGYTYTGYSYKANLFDFDEWAAHSGSVALGGKGHTDADKITINSAEKTIHITGGTNKIVDEATNNDIYTGYSTDTANYYHIPVTAGKTYVFKADITVTKGAGQIFAFSYPGQKVVASDYPSQTKVFSKEITIASGITSVDFRFGVSQFDSDATFSNIQFYEKGAEVKVTGENPAKSKTYNNLLVPGYDIDFNYHLDEYTATFNPNGGKWASDSSTGVKSETYDYEQVLTGPGNLSRTGYNFKGWKVTSATEKSWVNGNIFGDADDATFVRGTDKLYGNVELTAEWTATDYEITYNLDGGTATGNNPTTYNVETETFTLSNPTKTGYTFTGWTLTGATFAGGSSTSGTSATIAKGSYGDVTATAGWTKDIYTISYNLAEGKLADGVTNPASYNIDTDTFTLNNPTKTGYTFTGWTLTGATFADGSSTSGTSAKIAKGSYGNVTATAEWTANTYTVTLDLKGGTGGTASVTATYDAAMPTATMPTKTGYTFGGYYTETNGGGTQYYNADGTSARIWNKALDATLYAQWTAKTPTVTLVDGDGATGGSGSITATYGSKMPDVNVPKKTGYVFAGYYTGENGTGTQYYGAIGTSTFDDENNGFETVDKKCCDFENNLTLYARWIPARYAVVSLDENESLDTYRKDVKTTTSEQIFTYSVTAETDYTLFYQITPGATVDGYSVEVSVKDAKSAYLGVTETYMYPYAEHTGTLGATYGLYLAAGEICDSTGYMTFTIPSGVTSINVNVKKAGESVTVKNLTVVPTDRVKWYSFNGSVTLKTLTPTAGYATKWKVIASDSTACTVNTLYDSVETINPGSGVVYVQKDKTPIAVDDTFIMDFGTAATLDVTSNDLDEDTYPLDSDSVSKGYSGFNVEVVTKDGKNVVKFTPTEIISTTKTFTYTTTANAKGEYGIATVTIIPANNVYYEENFVRFEDTESAYKWTTETSYSVTTALKRAGEAGVYGYDGNAENKGTYAESSSLYSLNQTRKITVTNVNPTENNYKAYAEFEFTGTGFDIYSLTSAKTGFFTVYIAKHTPNKPFEYDKSKEKAGAERYINVICNTYSGYTYSNGEWIDAPDSTEVTYQVPVISKLDLDYGTYTVRVYPIFSRIQDIAGNGSYDFYLDAIRIYNPMGINITDGTVNAAYNADKENDAKFLEIRDALIEDSKKTFGTGFDGEQLLGVAFLGSSDSDTLDFGDYISIGAKNEVYLAPGQAISFDIAYSGGKPGKVALGVRNLGGSSGVLRVGSTKDYAGNITVSSTTDLFRDITGYLSFNDNNGNGTATVIIANNNASDSGVNIALTKLKVTYASSSKEHEVENAYPERAETSAPLRSMVGDGEAIERTVELVFNPEHFRQAVERFFLEKPTIDVSEVNVQWENEKVELGDPARLFITAPEKVTKVTVDGSEVAGYETLSDGSKKWTFVTYGDGIGNKEFNVVAFVPDGEGDFVQSQSIGTGIVTFVKPVIDIKDAGIEFENDEIKLNETTTLNIETSTKVAAVYVGDTRYTDFDLKDGKRVFTVEITPEKTGKNDFVIKLESIMGDITETITKSITVNEYVVDSKGVTVKWSAGTIKQYESATLTVKTGENIVKVEADGKAMKLVKTENGEKTWEITYTEDKPGTKEVNIKLTDENEMKSENIKSGKLTIRKLTFWERIVRFFKKLFGLI